jgi:hypothetical protein
MILKYLSAICKLRNEIAELALQNENCFVASESEWSLAMPDKYRLLSEELIISLIFGIIPSFIWASFNASPGYISEGWLNLIFGGLFIGVFTIIFWRPRTKTWTVDQMRTFDFNKSLDRQ